MQGTPPMGATFSMLNSHRSPAATVLDSTITSNFWHPIYHHLASVCQGFNKNTHAKHPQTTTELKKDRPWAHPPGSLCV